MTLAGLNQMQFLSLFRANGYQVLSSKYWDLEAVKRISIGKDGHNFPFRLKSFYNYPEVINKITTLALTEFPADCEEEILDCFKAHKQTVEYVERNKP